MLTIKDAVTDESTRNQFFDDTFASIREVMNALFLNVLALRKNVTDPPSPEPIIKTAILVYAFDVIIRTAALYKVQPTDDLGSLTTEDMAYLIARKTLDTVTSRDKDIANHPYIKKELLEDLTRAMALVKAARTAKEENR